MTSAPSASARHYTGHRREIQANFCNTGFCYYSSVNLPGMGTIPCFTDGTDVFSVVSCVCSSRAAISDFLGCFSGRYFTLSMFECHVRFERNFDKICEHVKLQNRLMLLYQSLPLHHSPGFWLVVPGKRRLVSSGNCTTVTAGNHLPHIRGQGQVLVFQQQFWSIFAVFLRENLTA